MSAINFTRVRPRYSAARFTLDANDADYNIGANYALFKSQNQGSTAYDPDHGSDDGTRYNVRIKPETNPIWAKFNDASNDPIYIAGNEIYEEFNIQTRNIFLSPADATTAQIDRIVYANDVSSSHNNKYVKLYAKNNTTGLTTVYGLWYNVGGAGTQPTDSTVDTWLPVAFSANDTASTISAAAELVVDAVTGVFTSEDSTPGTLNITHSASGARTNAANGGSPDAVSTPTDGAGQDTTVNILVR